MEYIMISMLTISIFTYIVYMLANKILAVQMHIKFLILCAFCAFSISLILPRMFVGFAGLTGTLCIVILFGLISSYFIARYYDAELQKNLVKSSLVGNSMEISEIVGLNTQDFLQSSTILSLENVVENTEEPTENLKTITESMIKEYFYPVQYKERDDGWKLIKFENIVQVLSLENIPVLTEIGVEIEVKEYFYPIKYKEGIISSFLEELVTRTQQKKSEGLLDVTMNINEEDQVECQEVSSPQEEDLLIASPSSEVISEPIESSSPEVIPENIICEELYPSSTDLDDLMDVAFLQKEQRNFIEALKTFRQALFLYPDSEVSPFLTVEIGSILKNLGAYNEAIKVFTEGRLLPGVINNVTLDQEFINNIAYLRVVKNILIKNSLDFMPLNQLSSNILKEIDDEFCEWRNQS